MKESLLTVFLILSLGRTINAQEVSQQFMNNKSSVIDLQLFYSDTFTSDPDEWIWGVKAVYIKNHYFLRSNQAGEPNVGISFNPSINFGNLFSEIDSASMSSRLLMDGTLNFEPSVFLSLKPEQNSKFNLFFNTGGGVKVFQNIKDTEDGFFSQWTFFLGGGLDFKNKISLYAKYVSGWHDVTSSTESYYNEFVNTKSTFIRYISIRSTVLIYKRADFFLEWNGYRKSFDDNNQVRFGLAYDLFNTNYKKL